MFVGIFGWDFGWIQIDIDCLNKAVIGFDFLYIQVGEHTLHGVPLYTVFEHRLHSVSLYAIFGMAYRGEESHFPSVSGLIVCDYPTPAI